MFFLNKFVKRNDSLLINLNNEKKGGLCLMNIEFISI